MFNGYVYIKFVCDWCFYLVKKPTGEYGSYPKWYTSDMPENFEINYLNYC